VPVGEFQEGLEGLHQLGELRRELFLFLILPGISQRGETRHERAGALAQVTVEPFEFGSETTDFLGIDNGLGHNDGFGSCGGLWPAFLRNANLKTPPEPGFTPS
jgi:hypothetical protein